MKHLDTKLKAILVLVAMILPFVLLICSYYLRIRSGGFAYSAFDIWSAFVNDMPGGAIIQLPLLYSIYLFPSVLIFGRLEWTQRVRTIVSIVLCALFIPTSLLILLTLECATRNQCL